MMLGLLLVSLAILAGYIAVMVRKDGIPASVSETFYVLEHPKWFTACMTASAFLLFPPALDAGRPESQFLIFLAVIGMCMAGLFPHFKSGDKALHYAGSAMLLLSSQIWVGCNEPWILLLLAAWAAYVGVRLQRDKEGTLLARLARCRALFWLEITVIVTTYLTAAIGLL